MRPDRIVVGECRGPEAFDMLQAMNTGHEGSLTTLHANSPRDALSRLESMIMMAGMDLPHRAIREQIAGAVDLIVQLERMRDGSRRCVAVTEIQGMEGDTVVRSDLFKFEQSGYEEGKIIGMLRPTGLRPKFMDRIEAADVRLPASIFGVGQQRRRF
jgi:pilus assembly protein CpaF